MSYARKQLARGEEVVFEGSQHWWAVLVRVWWAIVLAIFSLAVLMWAVSWDSSAGVIQTIVEIAGLVGLVVGLVKMGTAIWDWHNTEYLITDKRIVRAEGILNKRVASTSLEKVNDVLLDQSLFGRVLGFGDLDILTAADEMTGVNDFPTLADPVEFKLALLNQKEVYENPQLAAQAYQRQSEPSYVAPEPMAPRAGSDQVTVFDEAPSTPEPPVEQAPPPPAEAAPPASAPAAPLPAADDPAASLERLAALRDRGLITPEEYDAKKRELLERI
jgi:membrane protein YdbS with pleckstrin-like domain